MGVAAIHRLTDRYGSTAAGRDGSAREPSVRFSPLGVRGGATMPSNFPPPPLSGENRASGRRLAMRFAVCRALASGAKLARFLATARSGTASSRRADVKRRDRPIVSRRRLGLMIAPREAICYPPHGGASWTGQSAPMSKASKELAVTADSQASASTAQRMPAHRPRAGSGHLPPCRSPATNRRYSYPR
jgi:hypothetical protein